MRKLIIVAAVLLIVIVVGVGGVFVVSPPAVDLSVYEPLRSPAIRTKLDQKVIEVVAKGAPKDTAGDAIGLLFKTLYSLRGSVEGVEMSAPRARWPVGSDQPPEQWVGRFALPVPAAVTELPLQSGDGLRVEIAVWKYGETAEILHVGAYDAEAPTVDELKAYIAQQGYVIVGEHEEEYVKGPGMFFAGNSDEYYTIIRYPVRKVVPQPAPEE